MLPLLPLACLFFLTHGPAAPHIADAGPQSRPAKHAQELEPEEPVAPEGTPARELRYEPEAVTLTGTLRVASFYGPPGWGEDPAHDPKEGAWLLTLDAPVDVLGDDPGDAGDGGDDWTPTERGVLEVHVVAFTDEELESLHAHHERSVTLSGTLFHAITSHHRRRIMLELPTGE